MITFETGLDIDEVKRRILKNIKVKEVGLTAIYPRMSSKVCGNIQGDKIWLDHNLTMLGNITGYGYKFRGQIYKTESGSKIVGKFGGISGRGIYAKTIFAILYVVAIFGLFTAERLVNALACIGGIGVNTAIMAYFRWAEKNYHKQDEKRVIVFLENLLGTFASYEE